VATCVILESRMEVNLRLKTVLRLNITQTGNLYTCSQGNSWEHAKPCLAVRSSALQGRCTRDALSGQTAERAHRNRYHFRRMISVLMGTARPKSIYLFSHYSSTGAEPSFQPVGSHPEVKHSLLHPEWATILSLPASPLRQSELASLPETLTPIP
jgi:hypothetical protein